ncbi:MAG TPA: hypothetical protein VHH73_06610 [Verrucomicrobiae bacterium]|nr:hypothetical protein [Verrucomicrobiae bacterium]
MNLTEAVGILRTQHQCAPPCTDAQMEVARQRLPEALVKFYSHANGATLRRSRPSKNFYTGEPTQIWFEFIIPQVDDNTTIADMGFISPKDELYEAGKTWRIVCDLGDADYLAIETVGGCRGRVIECDHEQSGWPEGHLVFAPDFATALERLLTEEPFSWRDDSPPRYGTLATS